MKTKLLLLNIFLLTSVNLDANLEVKSADVIQNKILEDDLINTAINLGKLAKRSIDTKDKTVIKKECIKLSSMLNNETYKKQFLDECTK
ncbi:hypothetical protein [Arcobacter sp. CECT 8985]|uniref:hypothetical protein n=1 Tax=Arcobacter sp. CECT 8985 TaxID=1935424 RepID=UPI00100AC290|nr:hypothetical protein [Arcobacter sp. CECT 8985]RXJ84549.1 hypothetical protein CRU93_12525 [Arcobacter sp. CECT 8985]